MGIKKEHVLQRSIGAVGAAQVILQDVADELGWYSDVREVAVFIEKTVRSLDSQRGIIMKATRKIEKEEPK